MWLKIISYPYRLGSAKCIERTVLTSQDGNIDYTLGLGTSDHKIFRRFNASISEMYKQIDLDFSPDQISDIRAELMKAQNAEVRLYEIIDELQSQNYFESLIKHAFYITGGSALLIIFGLVIAQIIGCVKNYKQNAQHYGHNENVGQRLDLIEQKIERLDNMMGRRHLAGLALRAARVSESREGVERAGMSWKPQLPPRQDRRASLGDVVEAMNPPSPFLKAPLEYMQTPDLASPDGLPTRLSLRNLKVNNLS